MPSWFCSSSISPRKFTRKATENIHLYYNRSVFLFCFFSPTFFTVSTACFLTVRSSQHYSPPLTRPPNIFHYWLSWVTTILCIYVLDWPVCFKLVSDVVLWSQFFFVRILKSLNYTSAVRTLCCKIRHRRGQQGMFCVSHNTFVKESLFITSLLHRSLSFWIFVLLYFRLHSRTCSSCSHIYSRLC